MATFPLNPKNPDRICRGCEKLCPADDMCCGNGTIRTPHPSELMGDDWFEWLQTQESESHHDSTAQDSTPLLTFCNFHPYGYRQNLVEACATCRYFRFTGLARDSSAGSVGYCTHVSQAKEAGEPVRVSVTHSCPEYEFVADESRKTPYIRRK